MNALWLSVLLSAAGPELLAQVQAKVAAGGAVRSGRFTQVRHVQGLKRPVTSSGSFVVERGVSLKWVTESPVLVVLTVDKRQVSVKQGDAAPRVFDVARDPAAASASRVLFALFAGDAQAMAQLFKVEGEVTPAGWHLALTPQPAAAGQLPFTKLTAEGLADVQRAVLVERSGDTTTVTLTEVRPER